MQRSILTNLGLSLVPVLALAGEVPKKIIHFGWEYQGASPAQILANADKFTGSEIAGVGIYLKAKGPDGTVYNDRNVMHAKAWPHDAFDEHLPALRKLSQTDHLKESFIHGFRAPYTRLAWTDDAAWARVANNVGVLADLAKRAGIKGMCCDPEDYSKITQFVRHEGDPAYEDLLKLARQRGREVFGAVFRAHPEIRVLFYWFLTIEPDYFNSGDPAGMARARQDLWPAFADGILDVLPPTAVIIDGDEHAYRADYANRDFHASAAHQRQQAPRLLSPENRVKHATQVQVSFGLYLDAFVKPKGNYWYIGPVNGSRSEHFRRDLKDAYRLADEYVWLWGERNVFAHWQEMPLNKRITGQDKTWEDVLPGFGAALSSVRDADGGLRRRWEEMKKAGDLVDVNSNGTCEINRGHPLPNPYRTWLPADDKTATFSVRDGALCMSGAKHGAIFIDLNDVKFGDAYAVSCRAKGKDPRCYVGWLANGSWRGGETWLTLGEPDADGWRPAETLLMVPSGADTLRFAMGGAPQDSLDESVMFDDIHVVRLW